MCFLEHLLLLSEWTWGVWFVCMDLSTQKFSVRIRRLADWLQEVIFECQLKGGDKNVCSMKDVFTLWHIRRKGIKLFLRIYFLNLMLLLEELTEGQRIFAFLCCF